MTCLSLRSFRVRNSARNGLLALLLLSASATPTATTAATFSVDDSGTIATPSLTEARWSKAASGRGLSTDVEASVRVDARLNVRAWTGRQARIYMTAPRGTTVLFRTTWTTAGQLLPGELSRNPRALVWSGRIIAATLTDTLFLTLRTDGRALTTRQALEFGFEIDVDNSP
jgi:hypothetical protein